MRDWQPIETAPRDGSFILLTGGKCGETDGIYDVREADTRPVVAFFREDPWDSDDAQWPYCFWDGAWRSAYENPTHWMPLPAPPPSTHRGQAGEGE